MEKVVYILGAGFSAPLGLPVMSNFITVSKDLYSLDPGGLAHFTDVFQAIKDMAIAQNSYATDLDNIEEILSMLEMRGRLGGTMDAELFRTYIVDVINATTPQAPSGYGSGINGGGWRRFLVGNPIEIPEHLNILYGLFVAALMNLRFSPRDAPAEANEPRMLVGKSPDAEIEYSVVTLNYDMVLENYANYFIQAYGVDELQGFSRIEKQGKRLYPYLAKLHGSVDTQNIVPPTWNKNLTEDIEPAWQLAYRRLSEANYIRVIGYSLPSTDAYVRFLLKSAIIDTLNLKGFDVICREGKSGGLFLRYRNFVTHKNFRFADANVEDYLSIFNKWLGISGAGDQFPGPFLEQGHEIFMENNMSQDLIG